MTSNAFRAGIPLSVTVAEKGSPVEQTPARNKELERTVPLATTQTFVGLGIAAIVLYAIFG